MEDKSVAILLSVYNGEKYLKEQIDSILSQTYKNFVLYIRDDGSQDKSIEILKYYASNFSNVIVEFGKNVGYPECFYRLTDNYYVEDYYMFSDQDDYWLPNKIKSAVSSLNSKSDKVPVCYYSSYNICDGDLNFIRQSSDGKNDFTLKDALYEVCGLEFTMAVNKKALELLNNNKPQRSKARGTWMSMLYSSLGTIIYDNHPSANYRRHESAVTSSNMGFFGMLQWRIKHFFSNNNLENYKKILDEFKEVTYNQLSVQDKNIISLFSTHNSILINLKKVFFPRRLRKNFLDEISVRILFLFNKL